MNPILPPVPYVEPNELPSDAAMLNWVIHYRPEIKWDRECWSIYLNTGETSSLMWHHSDLRELLMEAMRSNP